MKRRISLIVMASMMMALFISFDSHGVTKQEMEKARTIAAKNYLRYANDGSGYLDEVKVTTMEELKGKLKAKEQENLKAFEAVAVPSDYASWDKEKLVEYWSTTFFNSPGLDAKGKISRTRTKNQVSQLQISAPQPAAAAPKDTVAKKSEEPAPADKGGQVSLADGAEMETALESIDSAVTAEAEAKEVAEQPKSGSGSATWVYIMILAILIGVVIWLVIYASKSMKESNAKENKDEDDAEYNDDASPESRADATAAAVSDNALIAKLRQENDELRYTTANLQTEVAALNRRLQRVETERDNALATLEAQNKAREKEAKSPAPSAEATAATRPAGTRTFYLGRVNDEGIFVRADREYNPKGSIYRFVTTDGVSGSFYVIDSEEARHFIALNPRRMLAGGCTGANFDGIERIDEIQTLSPGTAVLDERRWRVVRKAKIQIS